MAPPPFPSPANPANWNAVPSYNSMIMDPKTGTLGIPWNNFLTFMASRAAYTTQINTGLNQTQNSLSSTQGDVATLQGQTGTLQGQVTTLETEVASLTGQVAALTASLTALQSQVTSLQGEVVGLLAKTNDARFLAGSNQTATAPGMLGLGIPFTSNNKRVTFALNASVSGGTGNVVVRFGSGSPPAHGTGAVGTVVSVVSVIAGAEGLSLSGLITGLTPGAAYWIDLEVQSVVGSMAFNDNAVLILGALDAG